MSTSCPTRYATRLPKMTRPEAPNTVSKASAGTGEMEAVGTPMAIWRRTNSKTIITIPRYVTKRIPCFP